MQSIDEKICKFQNPHGVVSVFLEGVLKTIGGLFKQFVAAIDLYLQVYGLWVVRLHVQDSIKSAKSVFSSTLPEMCGSHLQVFVTEREHGSFQHSRVEDQQKSGS
jgi:hypothetical protein